MIDRILSQLTYNPQEPMIFTTGIFLVLFLCFSFVYMLLQKRLTARLLFVTAFSYYFYYKSSGTYFFLLAIVTASDYLIAGAICRQGGGRARKKWLLAMSLIIDLGLLAYFKYTNFFAGMMAELIGSNFQPWDIFLPVGISFYTFQSLSYTIDVYRGRLRPLDSLLDYAFYVSFFPQLVAGPIVRATDFVPQIRKPLVISRGMFARGVFFIMKGMVKKAIISDYISLNFVDRVFDNPALYSGLENLLGVYGYALQIYCDFSGYSDMAIGIALLLGFHFPDNFNAPYNSSSITGFWRRWHISLSAWIRDYIYISLGGNRKGRVRQYVNLMITMLLGGLWHGAGLNFIAWGGMHGLALVTHKFARLSVFHHDRHYESRGWKRFFAVFITFNFVCLTWVFFRNPSFSQAWSMINQIVFNFHPELFVSVLSGYQYVFLMMLFGYLTHYIPEKWQAGAVSLLERSNFVVDAMLIAAVITVIIQIKSSGIQPFIYFQF